MFKNAILRKPCKNILQGITSNKELGKVEYEIAVYQHENYVKTLERCGLKVEVLEQLEEYPDSCFVEDVAILTKKCAIITNPGATTRKGEINYIEETIAKYYPQEKIEKIKFPGTLDGGDVMMLGDIFYVGKSERTNEEGIKQLSKILEKYNLKVIKIELDKILHLKTGVNYLENNTLLIIKELYDEEEFREYKKIVVPKDEEYGANSLWINGIVIVPKGYVKTKKLLEENGYKTVEVDTSEFRKIDGGLSCLSLRF